MSRMLIATASALVLSTSVAWAECSPENWQDCAGKPWVEGDKMETPIGSEWWPNGVSILSPVTHGLPAQSCQFSGLHSAQATLVLSTSALAVASNMRDISGTSLSLWIDATV